MSEVPISTPGSDERALPGVARAALVLFLLAGTYVRVAGTWRQVLGGDEAHAHKYVMSGYGYILSHFDVVTNPIGPTLLQRLALDAFGASVFSYRLPSILAGVIGLWLFYPLGRRLVGRGPAWLATLLLAVHPFHVYYSRFARPYTLVFLLALVLVYALVRALEGRRGWLVAALTAALLPWMHLSTAATVASLAVVGMASAWRLRPDAAFRRSLLAFGSAGALCLALFAPASETLISSLQWLATKRGMGEASFPDVLAILGGSAVGGWSMAIGSSVAGIRLAKERRPLGAIFLTALLVPAITTWLADTPAISISYARYQFVSLVPLLLGSAWLLFGVLSRSPVLRRGPSYALGIVLVSLQACLSPIPASELFGAFSCHEEYWPFPREEPTPPFTGTPEIYHRLARSPRELKVVEYPAFPSYTRPLLANYERQHRQHTLIGLTGITEGVYTRHPYVSLRELDPRSSDADWVIVHKDLRREAEAFFDRAIPDESNLRTGIALEEVRSFQKTWGEPAFEDEFVQAWRFEQP